MSRDRITGAALLLALLATSCSAPTATANHEACKIALLSPLGQTPVDHEIRRQQDSVMSAELAVEHLERLGWAWVAKARHSHDPGYYEIALQTAFCMEAVNADRLERLLLEGHVLLSQHRFAEAEVLARRLVANRGLPFDHALLGDALMEQGAVLDAIRSYQAMMELRPGPQAYTRAAHVRWIEGDLEGAIKLMRMALASGTPRDPEPIAWATVRLAQYLFQAGHTHEANRYLDHALTLLPDYPPALLAGGRFELGSHGPSAADASLGKLNRAFERNPLPEYRWALIEALRATGHNDDADRHAAALIDRGRIEDPRTLALFLATTGMDAVLSLELANAELASRRDVLTLDALAWAQAANGEWEAAGRNMDRALREGTESGRLFLHAGVIAMATREPDRAREWLDRATALRHTLLPSERERLERALSDLERRIPQTTS